MPAYPNCSSGPQVPGNPAFCGQAGVLPVLRGEHRFLPWQLTPGRDPMGALTSALSAQWNAVHRAQWADEADDAVELAAHVKTLAQRESVRVVVAVDQLEEVFTACPDPAGRERFLRCRADLPSLDVRVTGCLRGDLYGQALDQRPLATALQKGQTVVGALSEDEICAVVRPARPGPPRDTASGATRQKPRSCCFATA
ncbi:nSTAND1 domain-containing NTPase [Streptomyces lavendulae]|uniref:nSTAND1 domain-containing NTPase n=1 Tax=Streptomyces lavendulae TaxID=1914 RepID=UPI0032DABA64